MWTVKELIEELQKYPEDTEILISAGICDMNYIVGYKEIYRAIEDVSINDTDEGEKLIIGSYEI
jgi:hypothetical protein